MDITFARRFRGPLTSVNGGYACGILAGFVDAGAVEVTLRLPPPLERPLEVRRSGGEARLFDRDALVAEARRGSLDVVPPAPVSSAAAERARKRHVRMGSDVFRECFVCGTRGEHDGLEIHVGPVEGREPLHAAPWVPSESAPALVWAAIDCPGAYTVGAEGRGDVVLGRMTARTHRLPETGEPCVVASWPLGEEGRKLYAGTALFGENGDLLAISRQVWIEPRADEG